MEYDTQNTTMTSRYHTVAEWDFVLSAQLFEFDVLVDHKREDQDGKSPPPFDEKHNHEARNGAEDSSGPLQV